MHRNRRNAELLASAQHTQCNLAAVCDQYFIEHKPASTPPWPGPSGSSRSGTHRCVRLSGMPGTRPGMTEETLHQTLLYNHQRLAKLHRLAVFEKDLHHGAA